MYSIANDDWESFVVQMFAEKFIWLKINYSVILLMTAGIAGLLLAYKLPHDVLY